MVKSAGISIHQGLIDSDQQIHYNQRHASINHLPEKYKELPRYGVIRNPDSWYKSFYKFFIGVEGYMSFMLNDPLPPDEKGEIFIEPIPFNEFVTRSMNLKETLIKYPNKARVFNNILRSQGNIHFVNGYFDTAIDISRNNEFGDMSTLDQFDMSLYEWFYRGCGMHTSTNIPMDRLEDVEELFGIKICHENKTKPKNIKTNYNKATIRQVIEVHKKFYDEINEYEGIE
jgi:hypothetical protein